MKKPALAAAPRGLILPALAAAVVLATPARAVDFVVTYTDADGYGFNDNTVYTQTPFSPSNPGTLGAARRSALEAVMDNWGQRLQGTIPITVTAQFQPLGGTDRMAVLAQAGPGYILTLSGGTLPTTWFNAADAAQVVHQDPAPGHPMIRATFNSDVGSPDIIGGRSFYYGLDGDAGSAIDFYGVTLHEFGHGLGMISMMATDQVSPGVYLPTGDYLPDNDGIPTPGIYDRYMADGPEETATRLVSMTPELRLPILTGGSLYFSGPAARYYNGNESPKLYAPSPFLAGSSLAHLDEATYHSPTDENELMTPVTGPGVTHSPGPIVTGIFRDIYWGFSEYTVGDAALALRLAAGLNAPSEANMSYLNVVDYTTFPGRITMADALKIARMAGGVETNPAP